jgi:lysyl-tRNA synthetase class 2
MNSGACSATARPVVATTPSSRCSSGTGWASTTGSCWRKRSRWYDEARLREPLASFGIDPGGLTRDDWLDLLLTHCLQPAFPRDGITAIVDYPASQCALARIRHDDPPVAERFELYVGSVELANGYHELNDASEQRRRFERDNAVRRARGLPAVAIDHALLSVLGQMPACAGVALGIERLLMCMQDAGAIADVLAFPFDRA